MTVDEYLARVLSLASPLAPVAVPLAEASGCVLAADVAAPRPLPPFDNSAMDGYAIQSSDLHTLPMTLTVTDDIPAGGLPHRPVGPGEAARIMTGAPMPPGADAVVPVEWTDGGLTAVTISRAADLGAHIRRAGEDLAQGAVALRAGVEITARTIALLAACDQSRVLVHPRPRVTVMSTGDELVTAGQPVPQGRIVDSNGPLLCAALQAAGVDVTFIGPVPDQVDAFLSALHDATSRSDLVVTSGGVSMGAYDTVKEALASRGVDFMKVAVNPGMPQGSGIVDGTPVITLPGNPVSSYVALEVFVRPVIRRLQGHAHISHPTRIATLTASLNSPAGKRQYARGILTGTDSLTVAPVSGQGSHFVGSLALADCLIVVPEDVTELAAGDPVTVIDLRGFGRG